MIRATAQAAILAALLLAPTAWLAHNMRAAQFKRAAADRAAWCAAHPAQDAGPEMCYLIRPTTQE